MALSSSMRAISFDSSSSTPLRHAVATPRSSCKVETVAFVFLSSALSFPSFAVALALRFFSSFISSEARWSSSCVDALSETAQTSDETASLTSRSSFSSCSVWDPEANAVKHSNSKRKTYIARHLNKNLQNTQTKTNITAQLL